ncbi:MAG: hypothetical protein PHY64_00355 [Eubacteriales bacterium]|nr:hypothetical protein [Eubacteriales bacterium]
MKYSAENLLALFDIESKAVDPAEVRKIVRGAGEVINYCIKTIRSGNQIEVEGYPIWSTEPAIPGDPQSKKSAEAISRANAKNARKHFERKMNANFTDDDYRIDLTYADDYLPDADQAWKDVRNYLRRVKYACRKQGLPPPKYMGVSEGRREGSKQKRVHHHIVIACGLSRDELEAIWKKGRVRADRLQADRYGYAALAKYMMKEPEGAKRYFCSRNLKEPKVTISGTRISFRKVERLVVDVEENAPEIFQKMYKGCEYLDCVAKRTKYVSGMYIYARLRMPERKPKKRKGRKP